MDNVASMLITEMVSTKGWEVVVQWLGNETQHSVAKLAIVDPNDPVAIAKLQERIRSYKYLLDTVENIRKQV